MTTRQTPVFLSLTTTEQAAHLDSIPTPDPARLQREYEAAMLKKAKASLTARRLARIDTISYHEKFHQQYDTEYSTLKAQACNLAAIALSRQVTRHI